MFRIIKDKIYRRKQNNLITNTPIEKVDSISGYDFEQYVLALFESAHFTCIQTSKSKDNGVDLIAKKNNISIAIQTKLYYKRSVSNSAIQEVYTGAHYYNCTLSLVVTNSHFSNPAISVAQKLNVGLIDRDILSNLISASSREREYIIDNIIYSLYTKNSHI